MEHFVPGEPGLSTEWDVALRRQSSDLRLRTMLRRPRLLFTVHSLLQHGHPTVITDLIEAALQAFGAPELETIWASIEIGPDAGLAISDTQPPPAPRCDRAVRLVLPIAKTRLAGIVPLATTRALGLELRFDSADALRDGGSLDRIRALIDALGPIMGTYHQGSRNYRIRDLRVRCGRSPAPGGVTCRLWTI